MTQETTELLAALRATRVKRYHTRTTIVQQTLGEHSANAALIVLYLGGSPRAVVEALYHDLGELYVGDLPAPVKWSNPDLTAVHGAIETEAVNAIMPSVLDPLQPLDAFIVKVADLIELLTYCHHERSMGNRTLNDVLENGYDALAKLIESACDDESDLPTLPSKFAVAVAVRARALIETIGDVYEGDVAKHPTFRKVTS